MPSLTNTLAKLEKDKERSESNVDRFANIGRAIAAFKHLLHHHDRDGVEGSGSDIRLGSGDENNEESPGHSSQPQLRRRTTEDPPPLLLPVGSQLSLADEGALDEAPPPRPPPRPSPRPSSRSSDHGSGKSSPKLPSARRTSSRPTSAASAGKSGRRHRKKGARRAADADEGNAGDSSGGSESGGSNPASPATSRSPSRVRRRSRPDVFGEENEEEEEAVESFIEDLFEAYSGSRDNKGKPLMNGSALRRFFSDFVISKDAETAIVAADVHYAENLERQRDMHWLYDLTKGEAARGLCLKSFGILLRAVLPGGLAHKTARTHFREYAGSADAMHEHLSGEVGSS